MLTKWNNYALAGRTQKPVKVIVEDEEVAAAIAKNREMALVLALLMNSSK